MDMIKITSKQKKYGDITQAEYTIFGIKRGLGNTLGNSLRRTIIAHTPGIAVTAYKMSCFKHEFDKCSYVVEDANEVMYKIKDIIFMHNPEIEEEKLEIELSGPAAFTAGMLEVPGRLEVVNKDFVICNISGAKKIVFQAIIRNNKGFNLHVDNAKRYNEDGFIGVTSVYSKIERINYKVEVDEVAEVASENIILEIDFKNCYVADFIVQNALNTIIEELNNVVAALQDKNSFDVAASVPVDDMTDKIKTLIDDSLIIDKLIQLGMQTPEELYEAVSDAKIQKQLGMKKKQSKELLLKIKETFELNETQTEA